MSFEQFENFVETPSVKLRCFLLPQIDADNYFSVYIVDENIRIQTIDFTYGVCEVQNQCVFLRILIDAFELDDDEFLAEDVAQVVVAFLAF